MPATAPIRYADRRRWRTIAWRTAVQGSHLAARPTARMRAMPDFLIVGAQRAGTTSLHRYLLQSPNVLPARFTKGVHWLDVNYHHDADWYRTHFPLRVSIERRAEQLQSRVITGEGSPYYLFHPAVPQRIAAALPATTRILVVLRDPVARAWSHYHHEVARGFEHLDFEAAIEVEAPRLAGEEQRLLAEPTYHSFAHQHHSYAARGRYAPQLQRLFDAVGRDRVLVLESHDLRHSPQVACDRVADHLDIPTWQLADTTAHNARRYTGIPESLKSSLGHRFRSDNERLFSLLGQHWNWTGLREATLGDRPVAGDTG